MIAWNQESSNSSNHFIISINKIENCEIKVENSFKTMVWTFYVYSPSHDVQNSLIISAYNKIQILSLWYGNTKR